jgi:hypothetical protein
MKRLRRLIVAVAGAVVATGAVGTPAAFAWVADPVGSPEATQALALCLDAEDASPADKPALLAHGLELAEAAILRDDRDATAHLAVFCNLGKRLQMEGVSFRSLAGVRRLRREIDLTIELAPDYADALAAKGAFLLKLPRMLGGDKRKGEQLLRRALALDPRNVTTRIYLAHALAARNAHAEASKEARRARAIAEATSKPVLDEDCVPCSEQGSEPSVVPAGESSETGGTTVTARVTVP